MSMTSRQNNIGDQQQQHGFSNFLAARKPLKKDRHSKIYTAQGLRDRRVRLSIEIARKFFDLQDMLGFDKASKTLDWLLTKSRKAIKQVAKTKQSCSGGAKSLSSTSECEVVSGINEVTDSEILEGIVSKRKSLVCVSQEKKMKKLNKATIHLLAKESRAKARERARERTREKLCTRRLHESKKCPAGPQILHQMRPPTQLEACERSSKVVVEEIEESSSHQLANHQLPRENIIEESIVIKRKLKPTAILGCQQNLVISNNDSTNCFPNLPLNWDINSSIARSTYCSITNMNLSTELQICGKTMEAGNILRLH